MFIIFGFDRRKSTSIDVYDENGGRYAIFYIGNWFSLFFIPLFTTSRTFFLQHGEHACKITKEEYKQMKETGKVPEAYAASATAKEAYEAQYRPQPSEEGATYTNEHCPVCKHKLEETFAYCPFCGQKQPKQA